MYLRRFGVEKVFGVPGSLIMPIWQNIKSAELVLCSHEQEASYIATGFAKMSKKPVAVLTTGGPGVTNCVSGIAAANLDSVPVIYISGRIALKSEGRGLRQEEGTRDRCYESTEIMKSVTKDSVQIKTIDDAQLKIYQAFKLALCDRRGAVHLSIPVDLQEMELPDKETERWTEQNGNGSYESDGYLQLCKLFHYDRRRLFILGWGCWLTETYPLIYKLAEYVHAPMLFTVKAYACMDGSDWVLGKVGYGYNQILSSYIRKYNPEEVIIFGSSMGERNFSEEFMKDIEKADIYVYTLDAFSSGKRDGRIIWHDMNFLVDFPVYEEWKFMQSDLNLLRSIKKCREEQELYFQSFSKYSALPKLCRDIRELLDENTTVTADAGNHLLEIAVNLFPRYKKNLFLDDGIRAMGSGICETVGMAFADCKRRFIAVTGDGCMLMNGNVIYVAKKYHLPIIFLVINNSSLGRVRVGQMRSGNFIHSDLDHVDYVTYANAFGIKAFRADKVGQCIEKLKYSLELGEPVLIEMQISKDEIPVILQAKGVWN